MIFLVLVTKRRKILFDSTSFVQLHTLYEYIEKGVINKTNHLSRC